MTKKIHPAQTARVLTGAAAGFALVGIVTGFQITAVAQENAAASAGNAGPQATTPADSAQTGAALPAAPAPAAPAPDTSASAGDSTGSAPVATAPDPAPAPAPAPAPDPVIAPVPAPAPPPSNGTTGGSAAKP